MQNYAILLRNVKYGTFCRENIYSLLWAAENGWHCVPNPSWLRILICSVPLNAPLLWAPLYGANKLSLVDFIWAHKDGTQKSSVIWRKNMSIMGSQVALSYLIRFSGGRILTVDPLFIWSPPYHSCETWARPAIILPSPPTDWPDCGHPFVSFQMTIKMGATAEDSRTGNRQTFGHRSSEPSRPDSAGIGNPPPPYYKFLPPQTAFLLVIHYCPGGWFPQCNLAHFPSKTKQNSCFKRSTDILFTRLFYLWPFIRKSMQIKRIPTQTTTTCHWRKYVPAPAP